MALEWNRVQGSVKAARPPVIQATATGNGGYGLEMADPVVPSTVYLLDSP